jgi:hypothetical protein|uniref:Agenet domain-containing protein n=1 Tax=Fagus sylvatica TaxID=28930 RepID=A0A2N9IC68_FAGSY
MAFFKSGDEVEVCSNRDGFVGSYYSATVIKKHGNDSYEVQYKNLITEDEPHRPLIETVNAEEIRPKPPKVVLASGFGSNDVVDAFDNDGWWVGKISRKKGSDYYYVFFDTYMVEIPYPSFRLRAHLDWVNGKWVSLKERV